MKWPVYTRINNITYHNVLRVSERGDILYYNVILRRISFARITRAREIDDIKFLKRAAHTSSGGICIVVSLLSRTWRQGYSCRVNIVIK